MLSVVDRCCRTCVNVAPDRYRGGIRCKMWDLPVSEREECSEWALSEKVVDDKPHRAIVIVQRRPPTRLRAASRRKLVLLPVLFPLAKALGLVAGPLPRLLSFLTGE